MKKLRPKQPLPIKHQPPFAFAAALAVLLLPFRVCAQTVLTSGAVFPFPNPNPFPGGNWILGGAELRVGSSGVGSLLIENGGTVSNSGGYVAYGATDDGTARVSGPGSSWTNAGDFSVGYFGDGSLLVEGGGSVSSTAVTSVGRFAGSRGEVTVSGQNSAWSASQFYVGFAGPGTAVVENSAQVTGAANVGWASGNGTVTLNGAETLWNGYFRVGIYGNGSLSIENGARVPPQGGSIGSESTGTGAVTVTGAGSTWGSGTTNPGALTVGTSGRANLQIMQGGIVNNTDGNVALRSGSNGSVLVTGAGSQWNNSGAINIATAGVASLTVSVGGLVTTGTGQAGSFIGQNPGGQGIVLIAGTSSRWTNNGALTVGNSGTGEIRVENGAEHSSTGAVIGSNSSGIGRVTVTGAASKWTATNNSITVGGSGLGEFSVANGGNASGSSVIIGSQSGAHGSVTVTGIGSVLDTKFGFTAGSSGAGNLTISQGGIVNTNNLNGAGAFAPVIGYSNGAQGTVTVTGSGSLLNVSSDLILGGPSLTNSSSAQGTLDVSNGAQVNAYGTVKIWSGGTIKLGVSNNGMLRINGNGGLGSGNMNNDGLIRLTAAPGLAVGVYTPIVAGGSWSGAGTYEAIGGMWNLATREFTVAAPETATSGSQVSMDLAAKQQLQITGSSGQVRIAFNPNALASGGGSTIAFTGTESSAAQIPDRQVLSAWDFVTDLASGTVVRISMEVGTGRDPSQLAVWYSADGIVWTPSAAVISYEGSIATFSASGFSSYAVTVVAGAAGTPLITNPSVVRMVGGNGFSLQLASNPAATGYALSPVPPGLAWNPATGLLSGTLAANATVVVHGTNAIGQGSSKQIQLKIFNAPSALWLDEEFGSDASNPLIAGWGVSPAGDGISNLLKYALGLEPLVQASQGLPQASVQFIEGENHFVFTIQKNPAATDVGLVPEITSDLTSASWNFGPPHLTLMEETSTLLKVRDNTPLPNNPRRFMRVKASLVSP